LLYVGQQSDYKNIRRLGEAHQKLLSSYPDLGLVLAGKKNAATRKNETIFNERGYRNILFTDFVPDSQLAWLYTHCTAYIFPSLMEGFGLPGLEAMAYGAPVVSSNATCLPEIYSEAAAYFNPLNTDDMAQAISTVLSDEILRDTLVQKGAEQIKKYSWRHMAEETYTIYMNTLEK
jgi:glycosyltransferase involved in cell wall biosynthesis